MGGPHAYTMAAGQQASSKREKGQKKVQGPVSLGDKDYLPLGPMG